MTWYIYPLATPKHHVCVIVAACFKPCVYFIQISDLSTESDKVFVGRLTYTNRNRADSTRSHCAHALSRVAARCKWVLYTHMS